MEELQRVIERVANILAKHPEGLLRSKLRRAVQWTDRPLLDDAIAVLADRGLVGISRYERNRVMATVYTLKGAAVCTSCGQPLPAPPVAVVATEREAPAPADLEDWLA